MEEPLLQQAAHQPILAPGDLHPALAEVSTMEYMAPSEHLAPVTIGQAISGEERIEQPGCSGPY